MKGFLSLITCLWLFKRKVFSSPVFTI